MFTHLPRVASTRHDIPRTPRLKPVCTKVAECVLVAPELCSVLEKANLFQPLRQGLLKTRKHQLSNIERDNKEKLHRLKNSMNCIMIIKVN